MKFTFKHVLILPVVFTLAPLCAMETPFPLSAEIQPEVERAIQEFEAHARANRQEFLDRLDVLIQQGYTGDLVDYVVGYPYLADKTTQQLVIRKLTNVTPSKTISVLDFLLSQRNSNAFSYLNALAFLFSDTAYNEQIQQTLEELQPFFVGQELENQPRARIQHPYAWNPMHWSTTKKVALAVLVGGAIYGTKKLWLPLFRTIGHS